MRNQESDNKVFKAKPKPVKRQGSTEIMEGFNALIDPKIDLDLQSQEGKPKVLERSYKLKAPIQQHCSENLAGGEDEHERKEFRLKNVEVNVQSVKDCWKEGLVGGGGHSTFLGIKAPDSFLIGTREKGLTLMDKGSQVYSEVLPGDRYLSDIVYAPHVNCYFLALNSKLYRKDINKRSPYLFMDFDCGWRWGACFRYSNLNQRLITNKNQRNISVLNPKTRKIELVMRKSVGKWIGDFRPFGENEDRVVSVAEDGHVILYSLTAGFERGEVGSCKINLMDRRNEHCRSLTASDRKEYILVEILGSCDMSQCSRMLVFQVVGDVLMKTASLDQYYQDVGRKLAMECFGDAESHILWIGLSNCEGFVQVYDYDTETRELVELKDRRVTHHEYYPYKLHRLNGKFYFTGSKGKLMYLSFVN